MDVPDRTNTEQLLSLPCKNSHTNVSKDCLISALQTSPLSSPSISPSRNDIRSPSSPRSPSRNITPQNSLLASPHSSLDTDTPPQRFVNALDSPPRAQLSAPRTSFIASLSASKSFNGATCIVCMDQPKDIVLAPCQHSHCCLACFRRTQLNACPICRSPVRSVALISTGLELPVSLVVPKHVAERRVVSRASVSVGEPDLHDSVMYERPHSLIARRSAPVITSFYREDVISLHSRTTSISSLSVARQAESSVRSLPRSQEEAFRRLRETGTARTPSELSQSPSNSFDGRRTLLESLPTKSADDNHSQAISPKRSPPRDCENIVLIGHDRKLMMSLAQKLIAAFPSPPNNVRHPHLRDKSMLLVNGRALRLVIIESAPDDTAPGLARRVQRQSPKLVLMCADFFNVSSFESIVRLDMEVLDYLNLPCAWALVKSLRIKRPRRIHSVEDTDVRAAKHFLSSRRRCFLITVDVPQENTTMRKLGYYLYRAAFKESPATRSGSLMSDENLGRPRKSWSSFCLRLDRFANLNRFKNRARESLFKFRQWLRATVLDT